jgi:hypothetical protein
MASRVYTTIPFERVVAELNLPARGFIPAGAFQTLRPSPAPGWDAVGLRVPRLACRRARLLYYKGVIGPADAKAAEKKKEKQHGLR